VLDADIRDFSASLTGLAGEVPPAPDRDERVLRLIGKWLAAGVIEDGNGREREGVTAGASVTPQRKRQLLF